MAADCLQFKKIPGVYINTPDWTKTVVQPHTPMDLWHGNVVATLIDNYQINADVNTIDGGFCIGLKSVNAVVGYNDFVVNIDIRHAPDSCEYNAVLAHEDKHINAYLSVVDDFKGDLQRSIYSAAQSVMPQFVKSRDDIDAVIELMNVQLQSHPDLVDDLLFRNRRQHHGDHGRSGSFPVRTCRVCRYGNAAPRYCDQ